jgi:hypothetical protein
MQAYILLDITMYKYIRRGLLCILIGIQDVILS